MFNIFLKKKSEVTSRVLFILKRREDYSTTLKNCSARQVATGMWNSASFVSEMLNSNGIESKVVIVIDNNCIDKEVTLFKPTHVFIEGFWVVPEKFDVLKPLHPTVKWFIRCHSELPFLALEGISMEWTFKYWERGVGVSGNSPRINDELQLLATNAGYVKEWIAEKIPLLPNYYTLNVISKPQLPDKDFINVGCFGAVRPLKNQFLQAVAAIKYANLKNKKLRFHINAGRVELFGQNVLKNLKALFENLPQHELIEHDWTSHEEFLDIISQMDICLQVSFTETFNIVTADAVSRKIPVVISEEVYWAFPYFANPTSVDDIVDKMVVVKLFSWWFTNQNISYLKDYNKSSKKNWLNYLKN